MGSARFGEVLFRVYADDHSPAHVHAFIGSGEVVIVLHADGSVTARSMARGLKANELRRALDTATENHVALTALWEALHADKKPND